MSDLVVVTGATGLLGGNLAVELGKQGYTVRCTRRGGSRVAHLADFPIEWVDGDISKPAELERAFAGARAVFHCAAVVGVQKHRTREIVAGNVDGTRHVIEAVRAAGVERMIHCSSVAATSIATGDKPVTEDDPWNLPEFELDDAYSATKHESEEVVRRAIDEGLDAVIVNPTYMIGPLDSKPSSGKLVVGLIRRRVPGYTEGYNNFVDVRGVAKGMILAWKKGRRGERYILGDRNMTYREFMELVGRIAGVEPPKRHVPKTLGIALGFGGDLLERFTKKEALLNSMKIRWADCRGFRFSSEKAKRELGYDPGDLEQAIRDSIDWFRAHDMI